MFEGRAAMGHDHGYDAEKVFYLGLAIDERYVKGCLERIGEYEVPYEEGFLSGIREDETQREVVIESLKADCEVRTGRPSG